MNYKTSRTYIQNNNFKDLDFSSGEDLTDLDLDIIESRSTTYFADDTEELIELYEESYFIPVAELAASELRFDGRTQFRIGNNLPNAE